MTLLLWILLVLTTAGLGWLGYHCRLQANRTQKLEKYLQNSNETISHLQAQHADRGARQTSNEEKLRSYLHLMDTLINTIPNPIYFKDEGGVIQGCNKVFSKQILGLTRDHIIGRRPQELPDQIPSELASTYLREELKLADKDGLHTFEAPVLCADGRRRDFLFSLAALKDAHGKISGSVSVLSDLTEKNRAAQDRLQKEKLEGVLETAGAVCHEFNQPLQALSGFIEIMEVKLAGREAGSHLEMITAQLDRMRDITDKLQGVTRYETTEYVGNTRIIDIHRSS